MAEAHDPGAGAAAGGFPGTGSGAVFLEAGLGRPSPLRVRLPTRGEFLFLDAFSPESLERALEAHERTPPEAAIKWQADRRVTRVELVGPEGSAMGSRAVAVKEYRPPLRWRLTRALGFPCPFAGDFARAARLRALGVRVPAVLAASTRPFRGREFLLTAFVDRALHLHDAVWHDPVRGLAAGVLPDLFATVGAWLRGLHSRGVWQRDLKLDNILFLGGPIRLDSLVLVDFTDARFLEGPVGATRRVRNLAQLLDLPGRLDSMARKALLETYLEPKPEGASGALDSRSTWLARVSRAVEARRAAREARGGSRWIDGVVPE